MVTVGRIELQGILNHEVLNLIAEPSTTTTANGDTGGNRTHMFTPTRVSFKPTCFSNCILYQKVA